jgi:hypothetical protein
MLGRAIVGVAVAFVEFVVVEALKNDWPNADFSCAVALGTVMANPSTNASVS